MIKTCVKNEGFEGIFLTGNGNKDKVLIVMSGSNGGMRVTKKCAEFYDKNGIPALALALFATKETQPFLDRVPVEYVENAIKWLKDKGYKKIGIDGMSKGSEMALVAASKFPEISCVIARVPSYFVSEGLIGKKNKKPSGTSCWSYHGEQLPFAPYKTKTFDVLKMLREKKEFYILPFNKDKDITPESLIKIESINAPILILSSKHDTVWPSYEYALHIENKLKEINYPYKYKHIAYNHLSHLLLTKLPFIYKLAFKSERKNMAACADERKNLSHELISWVYDVWE
ncbi:acyl-CoA thioester hydrolase/BAAT C-terminal domain-containing protein [Treponema sp. Marseille-Q3903]|uniref:acyl-CoA thioester hydrolase/BAAT C-terminal domain-containing protein n=1 Tax=Treponema sp. Marseille-Q3903 TaxID=2766703 RepID=UPI0016525E5B|nr:acyl-CoA thioester hydrolase/BAAT C-terminal domain-containing protein [Treponema sp. Marseille-Q3903]MBC6713269.1 hypothetical protein [Treponema sp. Marseille-Q3903]